MENERGPLHFLIERDAGSIKCPFGKQPPKTGSLHSSWGGDGVALCGPFGFRGAYAGSQLGKTILLRPCRSLPGLPPWPPDHTMKNSVNGFIKARKASLLTGDWI